MVQNKNIYLLTADLGFGILDTIRTNFPKQSYNVGAAEQLMVGAAIGLAQSGKLPICYSISPFLLYRPFELLRTYVDYEKINIKLVGSGRDKDYVHDGMSHWAHDDEKILSTLENIQIWKPKSAAELEDKFVEWVNSPWPSYLNLSRNG